MLSRTYVFPIFALAFAESYTLLFFIPIVIIDQMTNLHATRAIMLSITSLGISVYLKASRPTFFRQDSGPTAILRR